MDLYILRYIKKTFRDLHLQTLMSPFPVGTAAEKHLSLLFNPLFATIITAEIEANKPKVHQRGIFTRQQRLYQPKVVFPHATGEKKKKEEGHLFFWAIF